jgi:hypothetical protein
MISVHTTVSVVKAILIFFDCFASIQQKIARANAMKSHLHSFLRPDVSRELNLCSNKSIILVADFVQCIRKIAFLVLASKNKYRIWYLWKGSYLFFFGLERIRGGHTMVHKIRQSGRSYRVSPGIGLCVVKKHLIWYICWRNSAMNYHELGYHDHCVLFSSKLTSFALGEFQISKIHNWQFVHYVRGFSAINVTFVTIAAKAVPNDGNGCVVWIRF